METTEKPKINKLDDWSVHRICSGQVIISLAVSIKELVENALDAGATDVQIRTYGYGAKRIEVQDNGNGILRDNFESLCLKHHTSKLENFSDLESIATFGFRGEALSSLCALGKLSVQTKHTSVTVGSDLDFNAEGQLTSCKPVARPTGTTVSVEDIFTTLPVRHKQFMNSLRREFSKMVHFMSGYCLIAREVSMSVINFDDRGKRHEVLRKRAHKSFRENISEVFGYKEVSKLLELPTEQNMTDEVLDEFSLRKVAQAELCEVVVEGFVSNCLHGNGRSTSDRQFIFVNYRPCDFLKVTKLVNSIYHQFNSTQYPFLMVNIITPRHLVDVNLTPDKRTLLLHRENLVLAKMKTSLMNLFHKESSKYSENSIFKMSAWGTKDESCISDGDAGEGIHNDRHGSRADCSTPKKSIDGQEGGGPSYLRTGEETTRPGPRERCRSEDFIDPVKDKENGSPWTRGNCTPRTPRTVEKIARAEVGDPAFSQSFLDQFSNKRLSNKRKVTGESSIVKGLRARIEEDSPKLTKFGFTKISEHHFGNTDNPDDEMDEQNEKSSISQQNSSVSLFDSDYSIITNTIGVGSNDEVSSENRSEDTTIQSPRESRKRSVHEFTNPDTISRAKRDRPVKFPSSDYEQEALHPLCKSESSRVSREGEERDGGLEADISYSVVYMDEPSETRTSADESEVLVEDISERVVGLRSMDWTLQSMEDDFHTLEKSRTDQQDKKLLSQFRARISPRDNSTAESELTREITKERFKLMEILGQFNKGFIICKLDDDLFIVDQHAADEKFNFETLQAKTVIESQPLTIPQKLHLTAGNEQIVLEHQEIFEKNGFRFILDESGQWGQRLSISAIPQSGQWQLGVPEIEELIFMVNENLHPNLVNCRPAKVRAMFAMRACRRSVMVGDELPQSKMKKVVSQLSTLKHPWNCPHGRPTMRHLVNLSSTPRSLR